MGLFNWMDKKMMNPMIEKCSLAYKAGKGGIICNPSTCNTPCDKGEVVLPSPPGKKENSLAQLNGHCSIETSGR